jgi:hypothetical protein
LYAQIVQYVFDNCAQISCFLECTADALGSEKENFFKEMKMMKMVSSADNEMKKFVVNMVGCITVKEPLLLVVEFVKHGDLQTFLRTIKKQVATCSS